MTASNVPEIDAAAIGERLKEERKAAGLTQQDVADRLGVARTTVVAIEKGDRRIRPSELVEAADLFGCEVHEILRPVPTGDESLLTRFRKAPGRAASQTDSAEKWVRQLQDLSRDYLSLEMATQAPMPQRYPPAYDVSALNPSQAAEEIAAKERNRLGLGDGPVTDLRDLLESEVGLRIFMLELPSHLGGIFAYSSALGGCVAINSRHPRERQRWTLAHEYGHFLTDRDQPEVTVLYAYERQPRTERFADAFAENFLVPESGVRRKFHDLKRSRGRATPADLLWLAHLFQVSFQAMVLRLENLRLIPGGTLDDLMARGFKPDEGKGLLDISIDEPDTELLPPRHVYLAVEALLRGQITESEFAKLTRQPNRVSARRLVDGFVARTGLSEDGQAHDAPIGRMLSEGGD